MARPSESTVLLDLPDVAGRAALRAGLMAMRLAPTPLPTDRQGRDTVLRGLADKPHAMAFVDISHGGPTAAPTLLQLDATLRRGESRQRIVLTRLVSGPGMGHVSEADRRWLQKLGFADLIPEFDPMDCEGTLRSALLVRPDEGNTGEGTFVLTVVPPTGPAQRPRPRDVVFVLDRSGSMGGWKMVAARRSSAPSRARRARCAAPSGSWARASRRLRAESARCPISRSRPRR